MQQWRKHRTATEYTVTLVAAKSSHTVKITDVNEDGVGIRGAPELSRGSEIALHFMQNKIDAKISWQNGNLSGAAFDKPMDDHTIEWMRRMSL